METFNYKGSEFPPSLEQTGGSNSVCMRELDNTKRFSYPLEATGGSYLITVLRKSSIQLLFPYPLENARALTMVSTGQKTVFQCFRTLSR